MWEFIFKTKGKRPVDRNIFIESSGDKPPLQLFVRTFKDADMGTTEFREIFEVTE
jgi:hypothetical protein